MRRVLGIIREEAEEDREGDNSFCSDADGSVRPQTRREHDIRGSLSPVTTLTDENYDPTSGLGANEASRPPSSLQSQNFPIPTSETSLFSLLSCPTSKAVPPIGILRSPSMEEIISSSQRTPTKTNAAKDLKAEVIEGIQEIIDEISQAEDQIAAYAPEYIHSNELILTHTSSSIVQKFLLKAAAKRKFTVFHSEPYPNHHDETRATVVSKGKSGNDDELGSEQFQKSLIAAGITVIMIPDSVVFALMSRVNMVLLDTNVVFSNGSFVSATGARLITETARIHRTAVIVLCGVYKISPLHPFDIDVLMEDGDPGGPVAYDDGDLVDKIEAANPLYDHVPADSVELYITNL